MGAELVGMAASASLLAGWRLYLTALIVGLAMRWGWIDLPEQLSGLDILANGWVLGVAATAARSLVRSSWCRGGRGVRPGRERWRSAGRARA